MPDKDPDIKPCRCGAKPHRLERDNPANLLLPTPLPDPASAPKRGNPRL
jgi:hypothetical protein